MGTIGTGFSPIVLEVLRILKPVWWANVEQIPIPDGRAADCTGPHTCLQRPTPTCGVHGVPCTKKDDRRQLAVGKGCYEPGCMICDVSVHWAQFARLEEAYKAAHAKAVSRRAEYTWFLRIRTDA